MRHLVSARLLVLLAVVILTLTAARESGESIGRAHQTALPEPIAGAQFVRAYAATDAEAIARLASPLYWLELKRRGEANRRAFLPVPWDDPASKPAMPWLQFTYVDGVVDDSGFTHLLYVARSTLVNASRAPLTVWRVDLDPTGRVVWGDVVFVFGPAQGFSTRHLTDVHLDTLPAIPIPLALQPIWPMFQPQILLTITSTDGQCYYALGGTRKDRGSPDHGIPSIVIFFARDAQGHVLRGTWSYGEPTYREGLGVAPVPVIPVLVPMDAHNEALWYQYLTTLW